MENLRMEQRLRGVLDLIDTQTTLRAKLLNTLSYLEHIGATKIAKTQSGPKADFMTLKHAAEEARHAFYLKRLCRKIDADSFPDYALENLLAPIHSRQYLYRLDIAVARMVKKAGLQGEAMRKLSYLLVTYAIEVRADDLYPVYESYLENYPERVSVSTIIAEEEGHLAEMESALAGYSPELQALKKEAIAFEEQLFEEWIAAMEQELQGIERPQAKVVV